MDKGNTWDGNGTQGERGIQPPAHPLPPGGQMPDLNLAGVDGFNVASGYSIQSMPDPGKPMPYAPTLSGSPEMGGIDPQAPIPTLNLAGVEGVPPPAQLARPAPNIINPPDFGVPDFSQPDLKPYDLTGPGIDYSPEYAPDPMLPDLTDYSQPIGLDIQRNDLLAVDPPLSDLLRYDVPDGITISHDPLDADPLVPDLQNPQLTQDVHMSQRPGDLDPSALQQMHMQPTYQQLDNVPYNQVFMDQSGMNTARRRHYDLLMRGLDAQEQ
ncbi:MAG: hypothetical protein JOZ18_01780 [Chloroflexi bacterium]|nr:hypothetical protein [Chloroflexota bacterium]